MPSPIDPKVPSMVADLPTNVLPHLVAFLEVVDAGSFTAAARRASTDKTVMSRRVKALEQALGVRLLNRTTRAIHVTPAGRRLVEEAGGPVADALAALVRTRAPEHVQGTIRVASAQSLSHALLVPMLAQLGQSHPELRVELSAQETLVPFVQQGYELAIRVGQMPDSSLVSRKLASWRYLLVASPAWAAAHPDVRGPAGLTDHWMMWGSSARSQRWRFEAGEERLELRVERYRYVFDVSQLLVEGLRAGLGVTAMPPFCVSRELAEGSLVRLFPEWRMDHQLGIFGVTPHRGLLAGRVQVVLDAARTRLQELAPLWKRLAE
jgi:DNA-binding transcriptional LysR family regulator